MALLSTNKLSKMILNILLQLPPGTQNLKEVITYQLGIIGRMSTTRDMNAAWNDAKNKAARLYPEKFILDKRKALQWNDGNVKVLDEKISSANLKRLNELAEKENCTVDALVAKLISCYKKHSNK